MQYLGGKSKIVKPLSAYLKSQIGNRVFLEPFCGGLSVTCAMQGIEFRQASDYSEPLITLYRAIQNGWVPPDSLSESEYTELNRKRDPLDPMTAFAGYGCSFGAKFFGGYARNVRGDNYALSARNSLLRKFERLSGVSFSHFSYETLNVDQSCLVYCDPPYAETTGYSAVGSFDSAKFWAKCQDWAKSGALVFVSEYKAPSFAECVWSLETKTELRTKEGRGDRTEKLFQVF